MARLNLTIPDPLYDRLEHLRDRVNVSKVCAVALAKELDMLEGTIATAPNDSGEAKVQRLVQRFLRQRETKERWYQYGRQDGEDWAVERATIEELQRVGEKWDEGILEIDELDELDDPDEYPTLNVREMLRRRTMADRADGGGNEEPDWRAYLEGWFHGVQKLWVAARSSLR
jgi:post-segregation antitoxin (ccd killing protein)